MLTICCGGGGIPVVYDAGGQRRHGVEAVIDKDAASAVLAERIHAEAFLMLTDAPVVYDPRSWPEKKVLSEGFLRSFGTR